MKRNRLDVMVEVFSDEVFDYLIEHQDFTDTETAMSRKLNEVLCKAIEQAYSRFDESLYRQRPAHLVSKGFATRSILTASGQVTLIRRRYQDVRDARSLNLADVVLGLPASDKITPRCAELVCHRALDAAYQGAADLLENLSGQKISKTTVKEALSQAAEVLRRQDAQHTFEGTRISHELYCESDGCFIKLQQRHVPKKRRKTKSKEMRMIVLYEGKERDKAGTLRRTKAHYIATADPFEDAWRQAERHIDRVYDTSSIKQSYLGTDGDPACLNGADILPGKVTVGYDVWHLYNKVKTLATAVYAGEISALLSQRRIEHAANCARYYACLEKGTLAEGLFELADFINTHKVIIENGLAHNLGTIEGTNAHLIGSRLKNYGGAWSVAGADAMLTLRAHRASGGQMPIITASDSRSVDQEVLPDTEKPSGYRSLYNNTVEYYHQTKISWENESCRIKHNMAQVY